MCTHMLKHVVENVNNWLCNLIIMHVQYVLIPVKTDTWDTILS